jgi:hypothetical protein
MDRIDWPHRTGTGHEWGNGLFHWSRHTGDNAAHLQNLPSDRPSRCSAGLRRDWVGRAGHIWSKLVTFAAHQISEGLVNKVYLGAVLFGGDTSYEPHESASWKLLAFIFQKSCSLSVDPPLKPSGPQPELSVSLTAKEDFSSPVTSAR